MAVYDPICTRLSPSYGVIRSTIIYDQDLTVI